MGPIAVQAWSLNTFPQKQDYLPSKSQLPPAVRLPPAVPFLCTQDSHGGLPPLSSNLAYLNRFTLPT